MLRCSMFPHALLHQQKGALPTSVHESDITLSGAQAVETADELSTIAFSFISIKALSAGPHFDLFTVLADGPIARLKHWPNRRTCQ